MTSTAQSPVAPSAPVETTQSTSATSTVVVNADQVPTIINRQTRETESEARPVAPLPRLIIAWTLLALTAVAGAVGYANPGEQPLRLLSIVVAVASGIALLSELAALIATRTNTRIGFEALGWLGASALTAGTALALTKSQGAPSILYIIAPAIGAALFFYSRALTIRARRAARTDTQPLFPLGYKTTDSIATGSLLTLEGSTIVPVDAQVARGSVAVDERAFSTVPLFRVREEGEVVYAGSRVLAGSAEATALSTHKDSCLSRLQEACLPMIEGSEQGLVREDERAAYWTILAIGFTSIAAAISWNERSPGYIESLMGFGSLALVASLCQISEVLYGMRRALVRTWVDRGFVFGRPSAPKELAAISRIVADPSRIGRGSRYKATELEILDDRLSRSALCDFLASLLGRSEDPLLAAAGEYCRRGAAKLSVERVLDLREYPGRGILGTIHGVELSIGNEDFLVERGIMVQPSDGDRTDIHSDHMLLVAIADDIVARFHISDNQEHLLDDESHQPQTGISMTLSAGVATQLEDDILLVRGPESDLVGQVASRDVRLLTADKLEIRPSTILALTPELRELPALVAECKRQEKIIERTRVLIGVSGLVVVGCVFGGVLTPLVPLAMLVVLSVSLRLP